MNFSETTVLHTDILEFEIRFIVVLVFKNHLTILNMPFRLSVVNFTGHLTHREEHRVKHGSSEEELSAQAWFVCDDLTSAWTLPLSSSTGR